MIIVLPLHVTIEPPALAAADCQPRLVLTALNLAEPTRRYAITRNNRTDAIGHQSEPITRSYSAYRPVHAETGLPWRAYPRPEMHVAKEGLCDAGCWAITRSRPGRWVCRRPGTAR